MSETPSPADHQPDTSDTAPATPAATPQTPASPARPLMDEALAREVEEALAEMSTDERSALAPDATPGDDTPVRGTVVAIHGDDVFIDLGEKSQGVAPLSQFGGAKSHLSVGQAVEVVVDRHDPESGLIMCSRKGATRPADWSTIRKGMIVEGRVTAMNKGGLELSLKGIRGFMPASQVSEKHIKDISCFIGETLRCEVVGINRRDKSVTLSHRKLEEMDRAQAREKLMAELEEGQVRQGVVSNLVDYGAFVDLGGVDGLVHISDLSYGSVEKVSDILSPGQAVDVKVLKIDPERGRISLGIKQAQPDPWSRVQDKYVMGTQMKVRVVRLANFGAFAALEEGIDGLIPVSEMSWTRIVNPGALVEVGQLVDVVVIRVEPDKRRIALSMKQAQPDPWAGIFERFSENDVVDGKVTRLADFGAFVELLPGVEGLVHISELSDHHVKRCSEVVQPEQEVKVRVLSVDAEQRRISLSMKLADLGEGQGPDGPSDQPPSKKKKRKKPLRGGLDSGWDWAGGLSM